MRQRTVRTQSEPDPNRTKAGPNPTHIFRCKYTTDPDSSWQLSRWISARDVIANPRNILDVLSPRNEIMPCDQEKCKGNLYIFEMRLTLLHF